MYEGLNRPICCSSIRSEIVAILLYTCSVFRIYTGLEYEVSWDAKGGDGIDDFRDWVLSISAVRLGSELTLLQYFVQHTKMLW